MTSFRENRNKANTYNSHQKERVQISNAYNEEGGLGKFDAHRTDTYI